MAGFNTSTRKEDLSVRLRAHNIKNARDQTKRLEEENQKMEERLHELKNAMNREKEDRERKGGGFWRRGQTEAGSLTSYASEVLQSKSDKLQNKEIKKKKIKVLQDEPLDIPKRSSQPGTIKNIAQRKLPTGVIPRGDKLKGGPKCGQCEDRTATLTCVQCSEIFCFGCFSAFHLKGALKQHRSVPLSATGSRVCMSPRTGHEPQSSHSDSQASGSIPAYLISSHNGSGAASPPSADSSLLHGNYNESQSAASFQQALMAWRQGEQTKPYKPQSFNPRKSIPSPQKTPVQTLDESIGTTEKPRVLEIKFKSTLTYADRLLLKKHRRTELAEMPTPRIDGSQSLIESDHTANSSLSQVSGTFSASRESSFHSRRQDSNLENGHIDFQSLFEAVTSTESPDTTSRQTESPVLSNTGDTSVKPALRQTIYTVREVSAFESWKLENNINSEPLGKASVTKHNTNSALTQHTHITEMFTPDTDRSPSLVEGQVILSGRNMFRSSKRQAAPTSATPDLMRDNKDENLSSSSTLEARGEESLTKPSPRSKTSNSRAGKKSRPGSRAESRATSRLSLKGNLTKCPSEALKKVSQMTNLPQNSYNYHSPLEDFFLAGVEPGHQGQETPRRSSRDDQRTKSRTEKVSNRLYQMAPRSWRPDSSLGETIPLNELKVDANSEAMILAYSYSGQITGRATEWRPSSSQSSSITSVISPDSAVDTSLVFGDEMFTAEASQVAKKTARAPSAPRSAPRGLRSNKSNADDLNAKNSISSANPSDSSRLLKSSSKDSLHSSNDSGGKTRVPSKSSAPLRSKNDPIRHSTQSKALLPDKQNSTSKSREALKSQPTKPTKSVDSPALSRQNSQASEHSKLNKKTEKSVKTNLANQHKENTSTSQKTIQISSSDIIQGRSALMRKSSGNPVKVAKNVSNRSESDQRPLSSTNVPQVSTNKGQMRPNSSTGSSEPLRKTQPSLKTTQPDTAGNTVIADIMMSRVQEDGWVANQHGEDSGTDSDATISVDYDDGNDMMSLTLTKPQKAPNNTQGGQHWETEVRPFSGVSITSKGAKTPHTNRSNNKVSRPASSRPVSTLGGRESRAIVMDGDDLSSYDAGVTEQQDMEDKQALDQLEWELASDTGRLTADGQISRMSLYESNEDSDLSSRSSNGSVKPSGEQDYDIQGKLFEDERNAEQEVEILLTRRSLTMDESEVRALR